MDDIPSPPAPPRDYYTVMIHFYRGELGRIMTWRQRLDVTTNWAIVASTGIITFGLNAPENSHLVFMVANFFCLTLLIIEGRRYRYYDAFRARVRMLETHLILPVMCHEKPLLQGDWKEVMAEDLIHPSFKLSRLDATTRRFRRNYIYIFLVIAAAWIMKLQIHTDADMAPLSFVQQAFTFRDLRTSAFNLSVIVFYAFLLWLWIRSLFKGLDSGEFTGNPMRRPKWPA